MTGLPSYDNWKLASPYEPDLDHVDDPDCSCVDCEADDWWDKSEEKRGEKRGAL